MTPLPPAPCDTPSASLQPVPDWQAWLERTHGPAGQLLRQVVADEATALTDRFYAAIAADPRAQRFIERAPVQERLKPSLHRWMRELFHADASQAEAMYRLHEHIGQAHARIGIPADLVERSARGLKDQVTSCLRARTTDAALLLDAVLLLHALLDLALESMIRAYNRSREAAGELDSSFRMFSLIQNVGTERERQRALLLGWENELLYALTSAQPGPVERLLISNSDFGLWFLHKGLASFGDSAETREVMQLAERIDAALRDRLPGLDGADARRALMDEVRGWSGRIRHLVGMMFEGIGDLESGRDALTRLLNRRFLPTVLRREVTLHANTGRKFAVLMADLDDFKAINDQYGHETGDLALQHVASLLAENTRGSDYLFRYGGEEFVIVLGSVNNAEAEAIAQALCRTVAQHPLRLPDHGELQLSFSIGVAVQDGHPDYERILARADEAMYQAKRAGRNRVVVAPGGESSQLRQLHR